MMLRLVLCVCGFVGAFACLLAARATSDDIAQASIAVQRVVATSSPATTIPARDFVAMLENDRNLDEHVRFVGRLATAQDLELSQLQIEPEGSPNHGLRGERLNLHVKGDYPRIKALLIDTLAKFPGLVLQRMTVKHRDGTVSNASDNQSDDASLEFVQYGLASPTP